MPTQESFNHYKRYMETGVCACGEHEDKHVDNIEDRKRPETIKCSLTRAQVPTWNMIAQQPAQG